MKNGECPKCNSNNVFFKHQGISYNGNPNKLFLETGGWGWKKSELDAYICTECGYFETYITDSSTLEDVAEKWDKID